MVAIVTVFVGLKRSVEVLIVKTVKMATSKSTLRGPCPRSQKANGMKLPDCSSLRRKFGIQLATDRGTFVFEHGPWVNLDV